MKLLLLLVLIALVYGQESTVTTKASETKKVEQPATTVLEEQPADNEAGEGNKKLTKRSFGWGPWYGGGYGGYGWPWYGGWYGGWYPSWPWWYGGYGGYGGHGYGGYGGYGGWYGGHGGWYKKW